MTPHAEITAAAKAGEPERYLAALLAAEPERTALLAIAAFSAEMRRLPTVVTEPMMGEVRLQWWRDTIDTFDQATPSGHAIADALGAAYCTYALPKASLLAMTEARAFDLYDDPMPDAASLRGYLSKTEAIPFALAERILSQQHQRPPTGLADAAGDNLGHIRLLSDLPHWLARGRIPLPIDLLQNANITLDDLLRGITTDALRSLIDQQARALTAAHVPISSAILSVPRQQRIAFLPALVGPAYLLRIVAPARDPLRMPVEVAPLSRAWRIARAHWLGL